MDLKHPPHFSFKHKFTILGLLLINYLITYFFNVFLTQHYAPKVYGEISIVLMTLWWVIPFVLLGSNLSSIRFLPEYLASHELNKFYGFQHWATRIFYVTSSIIFVVGIALVATTLILEHFGVNILEKTHPVVFSFWLIPLFGLVTFQSSILMSMRKQSLSVASMGLYPLLSTLILLCFSSIFEPLSIYYTFVSLGLSLLAIIVVQRIIINVYLKKIPAHLDQQSTADKSVWRHVSLHLMLNFIIYVGIATLDTFMLALLDNNKESVGEFSVLMVIIGVFLLIQNATTTFLSPLVTPLTQQNKYQELQVILNKSFFFRIIISLPLLLIFIFFGDRILELFGSFYIGLHAYLMALSITFFISINLSFGVTLLTLTNHQKMVTKVVLFQLAWLILLNLVLIPKYHLAGAIFTLCTGLLLTNLIALILVRHYTRLKLLLVI